MMEIRIKSRMLKATKISKKDRIDLNLRTGSLCIIQKDTKIYREETLGSLEILHRDSHNSFEDQFDKLNETMHIHSSIRHTSHENGISEYELDRIFRHEKTPIKSPSG